MPDGYEEATLLIEEPHRLPLIASQLLAYKLNVLSFPADLRGSRYSGRRA
jgi:hypothetical protein